MHDRTRQVVLTTGANSGLGLAIVLHLAELGFQSVGSVRSEDKAGRLAEAAHRAGLTVGTVCLDVTDAEGCATVIDDLRPWAVVNNAGYSGVGAIEDVADEEARHQLETMVVAPMRLARLALPYMRGAGGGRIVNMSSVYGFATTPFSGWYQASKHALEALSDALRLEIGRDGIKVVLIEPAGVKTPIWTHVEEDVIHHRESRYAGGYGRMLGLLRPSMPFMSRPEDVAGIVGKALTANSPRARYLVGCDARMVAAAQSLVPTDLRDRVMRLIAGL